MATSDGLGRVLVVLWTNPEYGPAESYYIAPWQQQQIAAISDKFERLDLSPKKTAICPKSGLKSPNRLERVSATTEVVPLTLNMTRGESSASCEVVPLHNTPRPWRVTG